MISLIILTEHDMKIPITSSSYTITVLTNKSLIYSVTRIIIPYNIHTLPASFINQQFPYHAAVP